MGFFSNVCGLNSIQELKNNSNNCNIYNIGDVFRFENHLYCIVSGKEFRKCGRCTICDAGPTKICGSFTPCNFEKYTYIKKKYNNMRDRIRYQFSVDLEKAQIKLADGQSYDDWAFENLLRKLNDSLWLNNLNESGRSYLNYIHEYNEP